MVKLPVNKTQVGFSDRILGVYPKPRTSMFHTTVLRSTHSSQCLGQRTLDHGRTVAWKNN